MDRRARVQVQHDLTEWIDQIHIGDCRALMRAMIADGVKVQCIVTSPPYWGLRDYGVAGQFGQERTWVRHVARMRSVFRLCAELLTDDGTLWLNYGDSYSSGSTSARTPSNTAHHGGWTSRKAPRRVNVTELRSKNLIGMPWRVAFALQADGWYLRQDIIWSKPNPMPESIRDRCTKAHEYLFLMSKSERYFWDFEAMQEPVNGNAHARRGDGNGVGFGHGSDAEARGRGRVKTPDGWDTGKGAHGSFHKAGREKSHVPNNKTHAGVTKYENGDEFHRTKGGLVAHAVRVRHDRKALRTDTESRHRANIDGGQSMQADPNGLRNRRSVWTIPSEPFREAHFATFPSALIEPCILAGTRPGDIVFDPFMGSGTVAQVASDLGRRFIGCELNPAYAALYKKARSQQIGMAW